MSDYNSGTNLTDLPQIMIGELGNKGMLLPWFWDSKLSENIAKIVIYDQARVNGGNDYKVPWATPGLEIKEFISAVSVISSHHFSNMEMTNSQQYP